MSQSRLIIIDVQRERIACCAHENQPKQKVLPQVVVSTTPKNIDIIINTATKYVVTAGLTRSLLDGNCGSSQLLSHKHFIPQKDDEMEIEYSVIPA